MAFADRLGGCCSRGCLGRAPSDARSSLLGIVQHGARLCWIFLFALFVKDQTMDISTISTSLGTVATDVGTVAVAMIGVILVITAFRKVKSALGG